MYNFAYNKFQSNKKAIYNYYFWPIYIRHLSDYKLTVHNSLDLQVNFWPPYWTPFLCFEKGTAYVSTPQVRLYRVSSAQIYYFRLAILYLRCCVNCFSTYSLYSQKFKVCVLGLITTPCCFQYDCAFMFEGFLSVTLQVTARET